jgi:hypothetical protein
MTCFDYSVRRYPYLLDLLMDGGSVTTEMNMNYLLGRNKLYHRLDPE